jgi:uncharacterized membrane protein YbhN (UPF0104 family)
MKMNNKGKMKKIIRWLGYILLIAAVLVMITIQIKGIDLTEGQKLMEYKEFWLIVLILIFSGGYLVLMSGRIKEEKNENIKM